MTFNEILDFEIHTMDSNVLEMRIPYKDEFSNELGATHGGVIMTLADTASGLLAIDRKYNAPTLSSYTNFLRPIIEPSYIYARAEVIKRGKRIVTIDCKVWADDCDIGAITRSEFVILDDNAKDLSDLVVDLSRGNYKKY